MGSRAGLDGCGKYRPPPRFDPLTLQPVASSSIVFKESTKGRHNLLQGDGTSQASINASYSTGHGPGNGCSDKRFRRICQSPR